MKPVICIAGPTASGKSAFAVQIAKSVDGEIINADSMQVYSDLHILTARPSIGEMQGITHHLFGHVTPSAQYSVGQWTHDATTVVLDCLVRGKTPILVGGTGLYFKALTDGLAQIPEPSEGAKQKAQSLLDEGFDALRAAATQIDPTAASKVLGNDPHRLMRIVSVGEGTQKTLTDWRATTMPVIPADYWFGTVLLPERELLYDRINNRYEDMLGNGGLDEARAFLALGLDPGLTAMKAIGVPPLLEYLKGKISYEEAVSRAKRDTRRFAKRQFTWFRGQAKHWNCVKNANDRAKFRQKISRFYV